MRPFSGTVIRVRSIATRYVPLLMLAGLIGLVTVLSGFARQAEEVSPRNTEADAEEPIPASDTQPTATAIEADEAAQPSDDEIQSRLENIFRNLPSLRRVSIRVDNGVVMLDGSVNDLDSRELAQQMAERVTGAVIVVNSITRDRSIRSRVAAATRSIEVRLKDLAGNSPLLLLALAVVALALFAARFVGRTSWLFERLSANWFVRDLLRQIMQFAIFMAGIVVALQLLDATGLLGSIVGALGILGLAIGFATRDTAENYIASILLSLRQPFQREDDINVDGTEGKVLRLTPRATVLMSVEGNHVRIPNAKVYKATIVNYSLNPLRRMDFTLSIDSDRDLGRASALAVEALAALPGVLDSPPPGCLVETLGDAKSTLRAHAWIDQRKHDYRKSKSEAQRLVKERFDAAGVPGLEPDPGRPPRPERRSEPPGREAAAIDTAPDRALDNQMQADRAVSDADDLLDRSARRE